MSETQREKQECLKEENVAKNVKGCDPKAITKRAAMFMVGFTMLQPLYLGLNAARYTIRRFGIPDANVDLYITKINNSLQISCFAGTLLINIYFWTCESTQKYNNKVAVYTNALTSVSSLLVLHSFASGGMRGHLTYYYYMVTLASFVYGVNQAFMLNIGVSEMPFYSASVPLSSWEIAIYHLLYISIARRVGANNIDYNIVIGQIVLAFLMSLLTSALCAYGYWDVNDESATDKTQTDCKKSPLMDMCKARSPILMTALGLGLVYGVYPAIMPFKLATLQSAYYLDVFFMIISAFPGIVLCIISDYTKFGPNKNWKNVNWNHSWWLAIPYVILPAIFVLPLHYPDLSISRLIKGSIWFHGFLGSIYLYCHLILVTVGYSGAGTQVEDGYDGYASAFNTLFAYFSLIIVSLIGHGYLTTYKKAERDPDNWPTKDYGFFRSLGFWIWKALRGAVKSLKTTFSMDVRSDILVKKENLFVLFPEKYDDQ